MIELSGRVGEIGGGGDADRYGEGLTSLIPLPVNIVSVVEITF